MRLSKKLIILGASFALGIPLALSFNHHPVQEVKALEVRNFSVEYDATRTADADIYNYIGQYKIGFSFMYEGSKTAIFSSLSSSGLYLNDNLEILKDSEGQTIDIGDGILINGKTFKYWVNSREGETYVDSKGVHEFPMEHGKQYSPISAFFKPERIEFRFNLEVFQMDSIDITFKKDLFYYYANEINYELVEDTYFYTEINGDAPASGSPAQKVHVVSERNEVITNFGIENIHVSSEKTTSTGGKYHYYQLYTSITLDETRFVSAVPTDHDRYVYDNILLNGKSLTHYNAYCRANKLDFTNLSDVTTQNPAYENGHATGSASTKYDLAARVDLALKNTTKYIIAVYLSDQFMIDFNIGEPQFEIREGSSWFSKDDEGNSIIARNRPSLFTDKIVNAINELENYVDLSLYDESDVSEITEIIYDAESNITNAVILDRIDKIVLDTKASLDQFKTSADKHIGNFLDLLALIPEVIEDEQVYADAVYAAKEAYLKLSEQEKDQLNEEDVNRLIDASAQLDTLRLYNYKLLVKDQIAAEIDLAIYLAEDKETMETLINAAYSSIDEATISSEVDSVYEGFVALASLVKPASYYANETLDRIDLTLYREAQRLEVEDLIARGKKLIEQCNTAEEVEQALDRVLALIAKVKTDAQIINAEALKSDKEAAILELEKYAKDKGKNNYNAANWASILDFVDLGQFKIDASESKEEIATALAEAKTNIDAVEVKKPGEEPAEPTSSGCGGSIIATSAILSILSLAGIGLITLKNRKQK